MSQPVNDIQQLTSARTLIRNTMFNFIGQASPVIVAVFAIPVLINRLGADRFGVLTLAWMVIGYFSLFDFGLGRALTKMVAQKIGEGNHQELPALIWTALFVMSGLGLIGGMVSGMITPWLVRDILKIPAPLHTETIRTFFLLAASIPIVIITTGLRGVLEAQQRFGLVNAVRVPLGIFTFLGPLLVLPFSQELTPIVGALAFIRLLAGIVYFLLCLRTVPRLGEGITFQSGMLRPLISFGGWMTITNIVGPLMIYLDRFLIGALISIASVAYYATPFELITKLLMIPGAMTGVLFPAFASSYVRDQEHSSEIYKRGMKYVFIVLFPIILIIIAFAYEGLAVWIGEEFAAQSTVVLRLLALGVLVNSLAQIPFTLLQSIGRPDITSKLHVAELPLYLATVWFLLINYGIEGAAIAWVLRASIDAILLFAISNKFFINPVRPNLTLIITATLLLCSFMYPQSIVLKIIVVPGLLILFAMLSWFLLLDPGERRSIHETLQKVAGFRFSKSAI
jgi:O-antigen/teichoic acid export membrane protein